MGATNCPETPRQKMITMMYLVYTAMLALNVSAEVVEGFRTVGTAMTKSNVNLQEKLDDTYANFKMAYDNSPAKVGEKWEKAQQVREMTNELSYTIDTIEYNFIAKLISEAKVMVDPENKREETIHFLDENKNVMKDSVKYALEHYGLSWMEKGLDNTNDVQPFFIGKGDGDEAEEGTEAYKIKQAVLNYERRVKEILGEDSAHVTFGFNIDKLQYSNKQGKNVTWEMLNFREAVAGASLVALIRLKGEAKNAEFDAVNMLYKQVSKGDFKFDKVTMLSRPKRTYIVQGGTYETRINVGAYDSHQSFTATINGQTLTSNDSGAVVYRTVCNTPGMQKMRGTARVSNPETETGWEDITFEDDYYVSEPMATISLDNMNVLYTGVENPFTPSVPGIDSRNIQVHVDPKDGKITPGEKAGSYNIVPTGAGRNLEINVTATIDGKQQNMGSIRYRVKKVPNPILKVNNYESGGQPESKKMFTEGGTIIPFKDPNFEFKIDPKKMKIMEVVAFINNKQIGTTTGNKITAEMASGIKRAKRGDRLIINARVSMPDGNPTTIDWIKQLK